MNILLTGGTGLIGQALSSALLQRNEQLTILTRSPDKAKTYFPKNVRFITALSELSPTEKFDAIINLAGEPIFHHRWTKKQKKVLCDSRLILTQQLVNFINQCQQYPLFISGSATGIYGNQDDRTLTEESLIGDTFPAQLCQHWEKIAQQAHARTCLIRTGMVFSPKGGVLTKILPLYKIGLAGKLGNGEQYYPWISLDDMVNGLLFLLDNQKCQGVFNFTAPFPIKQKNLSYALASHLHRPALVHAPQWGLHLILGERANLLLESQNAIPANLIQSGFQFQFPTFDDYLNVMHSSQ